jgi:hypothetical protein
MTANGNAIAGSAIVGLDLTIGRSDSRPLGSRDDVVSVLLESFPGAEFRWTPSGQERIEAFRRKFGSDYPDVIREHFEKMPAEFVGDWSGAEFSVEFYLGKDELIKTIGLVLRGMTATAGPVFERLEEQYGWIASCPYGSAEDWIADQLNR